MSAPTAIREVSPRRGTAPPPSGLRLGPKPRRAPVEARLVELLGSSTLELDAWLQALAPILHDLLDGLRGVLVSVQSGEIGDASASAGDLRGDIIQVPVLANATTQGEIVLFFEPDKALPFSRHRARVTLAVVALENALHLRSRPGVSVPLERLLPQDWPALVQGRSSLIRQNGDLLVIASPPCSETQRRLLGADVAVVRAAIRGNSYKLMADELGCSTGSISRILSLAAAKLGVLHVDLLHAAVTLGVERAPLVVHEADLTEAERDVLGLLRQGLSNATIARLRARSERTVANQVSSMLRKTRTTSRRALAAARSIA